MTDVISLYITHQEQVKCQPSSKKLTCNFKNIVLQLNSEMVTNYMMQDLQVFYRK